LARISNTYLRAAYFSANSASASARLVYAIANSFFLGSTTNNAPYVSTTAFNQQHKLKPGVEADFNALSSNNSFFSSSPNLSILF